MAAALTIACGNDLTIFDPSEPTDDGESLGTADAGDTPRSVVSGGGNPSASGAGAGNDGQDTGREQSSGIGGSPSDHDGPSPDAGGDGQVPLPTADAGSDDSEPDSDPPPPPPVGLRERPQGLPFLDLPARLDFKPRGFDVADAFPALTFRSATFIAEAPVDNRFFVAEREGRIWSFENRPDVKERTLVLDISRQCQGRGDHGLLGFAFHPEFGQPGSPNRGFIYVHYPYVNPAILTGPVPQPTPSYSRLSRFTVDLDTWQADIGSELVLIDQFDENLLHLGGASFFRPSDGYLYLTVGDEGLGCAMSGNCGRINKDLFSGVLRIDVDPTVDADSHVIPRQPESGTTANYTIPNDNPFVGQPGVLEEFYALGLRSPHRMTLDRVDDIVWIGDVGANTREELNVLQPGANFQWNFYEGFLQRQAPPAVFPGIWTDPIIDFARDQFRTIIGGYVYRGQRFPELQGKYIFGDFFDNSIWTLSYAYDGRHTDVLRHDQIASQVGGRGTTLTSFGVDNAGELYITSLGPDRIKTLIRRAEGSSNLPATLSATGAFADIATLVPSPGLLSYEVQNPLWSDGAGKQRWISLPQGTQIAFAETGPWDFPPGTVFVKHFEMLMDERDPASSRRLETRLLVNMADGRFYGASYKWNAEQTDATVLLESVTEQLEIIEPDGSRRQQSYFYPGPRDCTTCHNTDAGYVLGVRAAQLNGDMFYEATGVVANQLYSWSKVGMFDQQLEADAIAGYPRLAPLGDESRSEEDRVRSYWDSNCSMCHGRLAGIRASWDARFETPIDQQRVVMAPSVNTEGAFIVVPGDPEASLIVQRDRTTDPGLRMPPLARNRTDEAYVELLQRWIQSLETSSSQD